MNVLGLDLSLTSTGVALPEGEPMTLSSRLFGVERLAWFQQQIISIAVGPADDDGMPTNAADLVVIEGYSFGTARQASHAHGLGELGGVVRLGLHDQGFAFVDVPPATVKKYATGKGNANKNDMLLAAAKRLSYDGNSNDEADALWLRAAALDAYGEPVVDMPAINRSALTAVLWPVVDGHEVAVA